MTAQLSRSSRSPRATDTAPDLEAHGIHRDPSAPDPIGSGTFAQRLVHRAAAALGGSRTTRRSFLTRTAVVGSALAVGPIDFLLKPGTAYGYVCGTCSDGWTAFCCTIMDGKNVCPPNSFVAGWWKADNAAYCCGAARYIIDCNAAKYIIRMGKKTEDFESDLFKAENYLHRARTGRWIENEKLEGSL